MHSHANRASATSIAHADDASLWLYEWNVKLECNTAKASLYNIAWAMYGRMGTVCSCMGSVDIPHCIKFQSSMQLYCRQ